MMERLMARGEELAREAEQQQVQLVAQRLRTLFGAAAVEVEGNQVLIGGRGAIKRWLTDPGVRFLAGALK